MQTAIPHLNDHEVVKYMSDPSRRHGFDVGVDFHSIEREVAEEDEVEV